MELESLIEEVKNGIGAIIQKPKMTDKLLQRPPLRFLHDIIAAVTAATGFAEGLFNEQELDFATLTEKKQKIDYLDKIFKLVGICKGEALPTESSKVVQGAEPENTCLFLIALAQCATNPNIDSAVAVRRALNGENPGQGPIPTRQNAVQAKAEPPQFESQAKGLPDRNDERNGSKGYDSKRVVEAAIDGGERGKSRGGTRGGKPAQQSANGAGLTAVSAKPAFLDAEIERCDGNIELTKELMGSLIQRPKMADKLLAKPPFRFLHDIVVEVNKVTGFANGLYSDFELDSANVSDKDSKIAFLKKIVNLVGVQLSTLVEAKPEKIVQGADAPDTNRFLQLLALAARHMPDSTAAVASVKDTMGGSSAPVAAAPSRPAPPSEEPARAEEKVRARPQRDAELVKADDRRDNAPADDRPMEDPSDDKGNSENNASDANSSDVKRSLRPTTARRRPPKVQDGSKEVESKAAVQSANKVEGILIDGQNDDDEIKEDIADNKGFGDNGSSAVTTDGKESKLVKDILGRQAEQEAASKTKDDETADDKDAGKAGSGIKLRNLRKTGIEKKATSGSGAVPTSTISSGDMDRLRKAVQALVQHTGPLGTCMDYIQEDISLMTAEFHRWEEECQKYEVEIEIQKQKTNDTLKPLISELNELEEQLKDKLSKISGSKATISKNEERIQQILKHIATS